MKLSKLDVPRREEIKLNKSMSASGGVMMFGKDNDYSNLIERLINGSVTTKAVTNAHARFITGNGFKNGLNDIVISTTSRGKEVTVLDLLRACAKSVSRHNGLYVHNQVNPLGQTREQQLFQFKTCKFSSVDNVNYTNSIIFNENFGEKEFKKAENVEYPVYNSNPDVIKSQFLHYAKKNKKNLEELSLEDFTGFPGQIYFHFWEDDFLYPLSPIDPVYLDSDSEAEKSLYVNRELRNGFMARTVILVPEFEKEQDKIDFIKQVEDKEGADGSRVSILEAEYDDETGELKKGAAIKIEKIDNTLEPDLFNNIEKGISNNIRKNSLIPAILIDYEMGALGNTSGEAFLQAVKYYNIMTKDDRTQMSRVFKEIFRNHIDQKLSSATDWIIEPLNLDDVS
jgi:hypothetical protein